MENAVEMPKGFKKAFDYVCDYYHCTQAEINRMKTCARSDPEGAAECYFQMYRDILGPAFGFNDRLHAEIAAEKLKNEGDNNDSRGTS